MISDVELFAKELDILNTQIAPKVREIGNPLCFS